MSCNYCSKLEGLPKYEHPLNKNGTQVYKCPMCTEFVVKVDAIGGLVGGTAPGAGNYTNAAVKAMAGFGGLGLMGAAPTQRQHSKSASISKSVPSRPDSRDSKIIYAGYDSAGIEKIIKGKLKR